MEVERRPDADIAPSTRASDADRERTARALRAHFAAGRLDAAEHERRVALAMTATTRRELRALTRDLPRTRARSPERRAAVHRTLLRWHAAAYVTGNATVAAAWAVEGGTFWPAAVLVPTSALLGTHAWMTRRVRRRRRR